jgi:hypothetical protein
VPSFEHDIRLKDSNDNLKYAAFSNVAANEVISIPGANRIIEVWDKKLVGSPHDLILRVEGGQIVDATGNNTLTVTSTGVTQSTTKVNANFENSIYFDTTSGYIQIPASSRFLFTGDFTIAAWVRSDSVTNNAYGYICGTGLSGQNNQFGSRVSGVFAYYYPSPLDGGGELGTYYHVAVIRVNCSLRIHTNGILTNSVTNTANLGHSNQVFRVGLRADNILSFHGYIQELVVNNGTALWTANFTPPTTPTTATGGADNYTILEPKTGWDIPGGIITYPRPTVSATDEYPQGNSVRRLAAGTADMVVAYV